MNPLKSVVTSKLLDTFKPADSQNVEEMDPQSNMQENIVCTSHVSNVKTNIVHVVTRPTPTNNTDVTSSIVTPLPTTSVLQVVTAGDSNLNAGITDQNTSPDIKNDLLCDTKLQNQPVTLVCEPDIVNRMKEMEGDININQNLTVAHKQLSSKRGMRKKEEKLGFKKEKRTGQSPPKVLKKKPKQIRDLEKTLNCLLSDSELVKDEKAFAFAQSYFLKVTETLYGKDDATYNKFMKTMNDFGITIFDATELFKKVTKIFENYPDLAEEFLAFLLPEQAMECGKFMEYIILTKMKSFCRKLEVYYAKQPSQLRKIYSSLAALASNDQATTDDLRNTIIPLLKNNSLLVNMFLELMPTEAPHASSLNYYECMDFKRVNLQNPSLDDWFETVEVPTPIEDNMYGGEDCICSCHLPSENNKRQPKHCVSCGTKFIQGRVYIRSGGMLHPAKVSFKEMKSKVLERLSVKSLKSQKVGRNQIPVPGNKKNCVTKGDSPSGNIPKASGKTTTSKTSKKRTKGKSFKEDQKKSCKTLSSSKSSLNKKANNDKNLPKSARKRISHNEDYSSKQSCKSISVSSKKNISKVGKGGGKSVPKPCFKAELQLNDACYVPIESSCRGARSTSRSKVFPSDSMQNCDHKQSDIVARGETSNATLSVLVNRMSEAELMLNTHGKSICAEDGKEELDEALTNVSDLCQTELLNKQAISESDDENEEDISDIQCNRNLCNESVYTELTCFDSSSKVIRNSGKIQINTIETTIVKRTFDANILSACGRIGDKQNTTQSLNNDNNNEQNHVLECTNLEHQCEGFVHCSESACTYSASSGHSNVTMQECKRDNLSCSTDNLSCSEAEDLSYEKMELDTTDENISSEEEKNVLDLDNIHSDSSMESNIKDSSQMDFEDFCDVLESSPSSHNRDSNSDSDCDRYTSEKSDLVPLKHIDASWTRDEDKVILRTFQSVNGSELVFEKICDQLPNRNADEVRLRFQALMSFLQKITDDPIHHD